MHPMQIEDIGTSRPISRWLGQRGRREALLSTLILGAGIWQLVVREVYHRGSSEVYGVTVLLVTWLLYLGLAKYANSRCKAQAARIFKRVSTVTVLATTLYQIGALPGLQGWGQHPSPARVLTAAAAFALAAGLACKLSERRWADLCLALCAAALIWLAAPVVLSSFRAPTKLWPPGAETTALAGDHSRTVTIALLLDEMNGRDGKQVADELRSAGLHVSETMVPSVGENTRNVVATMFHGEVFRDAQPCGFFTLCTEQLALDFTRLRAARPDIDVVGTAHPYCAIQGLRSCVRQVGALTWFDTQRFQCALWRRFGNIIPTSEDRCRAVYLDQYTQANGQQIDRVLNAKALREGGFLFAHILLPHPPGANVHGTLSSHYRDNLQVARSLIRKMLERAKTAGLETRIVVFSDHPLRQELWCSSFAPYIWDQCTLDPSLQDSTVPIVVGATQSIDISTVTSNRNIFELAGRLAALP